MPTPAPAAGDSYYDSTAGNTGGAYRTDDVDIKATDDAGGGYHVGWITSGEWLQYQLATVEAGTYDISVRVSTPYNGKKLRIVLDGNVLATLTLPNTGRWNNWQTVTAANVPVPAGVNAPLRVEMLSSLFNLNWIKFE